MANRSSLIALALIAGCAFAAVAPAAATGAATTDPGEVTFAIKALNATGAASLLTASTVATIFAPSDAAFEALAASFNLSSPADLWGGDLSPIASNITLLHVIPGVALKSTDLPDNQKINGTSLLGPIIYVKRSGSTVVVSTSKASKAQVIKADIPFNSAIVHVIDTVLVPPS